ncbi:hypothetical protein JQ596_35385 [Bradyrhizobium manausense]|uniref:hypothetical protein n=1 Tax=Bradyrhizobium TaxID=374 RepID=UPI001BAB3CEA|nr:MULTISPECIES: hypothetical protein [Bradyrhizobium]MBR0830801.1 hypothetical protein [Bradyrhizobium manausense]UVO28663.1 hypothetical protein KUF59_40520 [Bradyrhizobium arachidis]
MRASTAYFVGAGTIVAAIAIGLGGGLIAGNIMHPVTSKQGPDTAKYEARTEPVAAVAARAPSERVQYLRGSQAFGAAILPPAQAEPQTKTASTEPSVPAPAANDAKTANTAAAPAAPAAKPAEQQAARETPAAPENAYAKASESDVKRAAREQRRAERRQHWAERRRQEMREPRDRTDWNDVARSVREDSESREFIASRRPALPQIRLFGSDDDD